ncbi:hypothetical protein ACNO5E_26755 [Vibrio parahaemolyticus]|jgi:hypothetical protein
MKIQNQQGVRAALVTDWLAIDFEEYALCNLEVISQLLNQCKDLHEIDTKDLSHALFASVEILNATRRKELQVGE